MTRKLDIEDALDRSLANQVKVRRLERRFDAAVWARIDAAQQRATNPVSTNAKPQAAARWLFISNLVGVGVAVLLVAIFGLQSMPEVSVNLPAPPVEVSAATRTLVINFGGQAIAAVALVFGLMFTPLGRKIRSQFS